MDLSKLNEVIALSSQGYVLHIEMARYLRDIAMTLYLHHIVKTRYLLHIVMMGICSSNCSNKDMFITLCLQGYGRCIATT
jgi:hypothetical protein